MVSCCTYVSYAAYRCLFYHPGDLFHQCFHIQKHMFIFREILIFINLRLIFAIAVGVHSVNLLGNSDNSNPIASMKFWPKNYDFSSVETLGFTQVPTPRLQFRPEPRWLPEVASITSICIYCPPYLRRVVVAATGCGKILAKPFSGVRTTCEFSSIKM